MNWPTEYTGYLLLLGMLPVSGFIVPARDVGAMVDTLETCMKNLSTNCLLAESARKLSAQLNVTAYGSRIKYVLIGSAD